MSAKKNMFSPYYSNKKQTLTQFRNGAARIALVCGSRIKANSFFPFPFFLSTFLPFQIWNGIEEKKIDFETRMSQGISDEPS